MDFSNEIIKRAKTASSAEELMRMAAEEGIELTAEEAGQYFDFLHSTKALSDEELEIVTGGKGKKSPPSPKYHSGQSLWIGFPTSQTYVGIQVVYPEFYTEGNGWRYLIRNERNLYDNRALETDPYVKTYKPKEWED